jgi:hypothetical protein
LMAFYMVHSEGQSRGHTRYSVLVMWHLHLNSLARTR